MRIFDAAGARELQEECDAIGYCETGRAVITQGYALNAKYIIHTPGPIWDGGENNEEQLLRSCYINSLNLAKENSCESVAFPLISSGIYGFQKQSALQIARDAIREFLASNEMEVFLTVLDKAAFSVSENLFDKLTELFSGLTAEIKRDSSTKTAALYEEADPFDSIAKLFTDRVALPVPASNSVVADLKTVVENIDEPFSATLFRIIDASGKTDTEVYKRANLDRRLFSKIRSNADYMPSKKTAFALAIALELSLDETEDFLKKAGFSLSKSQKFDVIVEHFIKNRDYDIFKINEALFYFDQSLLGG
jgi:O-acetyl-ADP-ribose deacetylase (regulator of RNase III)